MNLLKVELTKLLKKTSTQVFLILYAIIVLGGSAVYVIAESRFDLSIYSGVQFVGASLGSMMAFLLPLMTIYFAGSSQSIDFSRGTMKNMYLLPISRTELFISKYNFQWLLIFNNLFCLLWNSTITVLHQSIHNVRLDAQ